MPPEQHRPKHARQAGASLGLFALLLQVYLLAWHTHPLPFSAPGQPLALSSPISGSPVSPAVADDECQICLSLNLSAAPVIAPELPLPPRLAAAVRPGEAVNAGGTPSTGFHARAPPRLI